ncbi:MAG: hypothetical protein AB1521_04620 [Bacteroidota bacterium]
MCVEKIYNWWEDEDDKSNSFKELHADKILLEQNLPDGSQVYADLPTRVSEFAASKFFI